MSTINMHKGKSNINYVLIVRKKVIQPIIVGINLEFNIDYMNNLAMQRRFVINDGYTHYMTFNANLFIEMDNNYASKVKMGNEESM